MLANLSIAIKARRRHWYIANPEAVVIEYMSNTIDLHRKVCEIQNNIFEIQNHISTQHKTIRYSLWSILRAHFVEVSSIRAVIFIKTPIIQRTTTNMCTSTILIPLGCFQLFIPILFIVPFLFSITSRTPFVSNEIFRKTLQKVEATLSLTFKPLHI